MASKFDAIQRMRKPNNKDEIRAFVGLINYYGRFLKNLSSTLYPINNLLKISVPFKWMKQCDDAFQEVKMKCSQTSFWLTSTQIYVIIS